LFLFCFAVFSCEARSELVHSSKSSTQFSTQLSTLDRLSTEIAILEEEEGLSCVDAINLGVMIFTVAVGIAMLAVPGAGAVLSLGITVLAVTTGLGIVAWMADKICAYKIGFGAWHRTMSAMAFHHYLDRFARVLPETDQDGFLVPVPYRDDDGAGILLDTIADLYDAYAFKPKAFKKSLCTDSKAQVDKVVLKKEEIAARKRTLGVAKETDLDASQLSALKCDVYLTYFLNKLSGIWGTQKYGMIGFRVESTRFDMIAESLVADIAEFKKTKIHEQLIDMVINLNKDRVQLLNQLVTANKLSKTLHDYLEQLQGRVATLLAWKRAPVIRVVQMTVVVLVERTATGAVTSAKVHNQRTRFPY